MIWSEKWSVLVFSFSLQILQIRMWIFLMKWRTWNVRIWFACILLRTAFLMMIRWGLTLSKTRFLLGCMIFEWSLLLCEIQGFFITSSDGVVVHKFVKSWGVYNIIRRAWMTILCRLVWRTICIRRWVLIRGVMLRFIVFWLLFSNFV